MRALIYEVEEALGAGALDLAGRPLLTRQLQWLREIGIEEVIIEVVDGPLSVACAELVLGSDPLMARCSVLPTRAPLGPRELALRADLRLDELFLALPANVVAEGSFELPEAPLDVALAAPPFALDESAVQLAFRSVRALDAARPLAEEAAAAQEEGESPSEGASLNARSTGALLPGTPNGNAGAKGRALAEVRGWALTVGDPATAHTLSCAAIAGQAPGLLIHAAEVKPGIWYARGARVAEDATLVAPVLVGPDARVFGRARLGPNVVVGRQAVIERDAVLSEVSIAPSTLVGEGARLRQAYVDPSGYSSFVDGARTEVRDPLLLASSAPSPLSLGARLLAAAALLLWLAPWCAVALFARILGRRALAAHPFRGARLLDGTLGLPLLDVVPRLCDVVLGRRSLVGLSEGALEEIAGRHDGARPGALSIDRALAPQSAEIRRYMARWYLNNKSFEVDRKLLRERLRRRPAPSAGGSESRSF